jgi:hypothetical protein
MHKQRQTNPFIHQRFPSFPSVNVVKTNCSLIVDRSFNQFLCLLLFMKQKISEQISD